MVENKLGRVPVEYRGHLIMTDKWFDEYMFRVVARKEICSCQGAGYFKTETNPSSGSGTRWFADEE